MFSLEETIIHLDMANEYYICRSPYIELIDTFAEEERKAIRSFIKASIFNGEYVAVDLSRLKVLDKDKHLYRGYPVSIDGIEIPNLTFTNFPDTHINNGWCIFYNKNVFLYDGVMFHKNIAYDYCESTKVALCKRIQSNSHSDAIESAIFLSIANNFMKIVKKESVKIENNYMFDILKS